MTPFRSVFCDDLAEGPDEVAGDDEPPSLELLEPEPERTMLLNEGEDFEIVATVEDQSCIDRVELFVNEEMVGVARTGELDPLVVPVLQVAVGSYLVYVRAYDSSDLPAYSGHAWVEVQ